MTLAAMQMVKCAGCSSVYVRPESGPYCSDCLELEATLEAKRKFEERRNRNYGVGKYAPEVCEASDLPTILAGASVKDQLIGTALCAAGLIGGVGAAYLLWLGARQAIAMLLRWSS